MLGVNTEVEDDRDREGARGWEKLHTIFSAVWYKGKAIITGVLLKQVRLGQNHLIFNHTTTHASTG